MKRRHFFAALFGVPLFSACGQNISMRSFEQALSENRGLSARIDPNIPERIPYASITVSIPNIRQALLILGRAEGDDLYWLSADRSLLVTRHGRLVRTLGQREDVTNTHFSSPDFLSPGQGYRDGAVFTRTIDLTPGNRFGIPVRSTLHVGEEALRLIGKRELKLRQLVEYGESPLLSWRFVNRFWVDESGVVWRSEQQPAPEAPMIAIELMRPYRAG